MVSGSLPSSSTPNPSTYPLFVLYRQISELPLDVFIDCICDGNYKGIIISGIPSVEDLQKAWDILYDEFIVKMQDEDGKYLTSLVHELNILRTDINAVETIVKFIEYLLGAKIKVNLDSLVTRLNKYTGFAMTLNQHDIPACLTVLQGVLSITKRWYVEAENIKMQINQTISMQENHGALDRDYFDYILVALSISQKFKVNRKETTVGEFVVMIQTLRKQKDNNEFSNN